MASSETELSQDVVFDILSSPRRRYVLYYLRTTEDSIKLTDLAEQVAAWENNTEPDEITEQERKRVYVSLYQTHIPRLAEAGIIDYNKETGDIALSSEGKDIDDYLQPVQDDRPWQQYYLALAAASIVLLALTAFEISIFALLSEAFAAAFVVAAFAILTIAHSYIRFSDQRSVPSELRQRE